MHQPHKERTPTTNTATETRKYYEYRERITGAELSITYSLALLYQLLVALIAYSLGFTYKVHEIHMQYKID